MFGAFPTLRNSMSINSTSTRAMFQKSPMRKPTDAMEEDGENSWKLTNIGGVGSAEDIALRADAALTEESFEEAGSKPGIEVWRVEKFEIERIPALNAGNLSMYAGDAYLILNTVADEDGNFTYALHYWIGAESTQDESAAVAYYAVTLDDLLGQKPVQYRETQDEESALFHSYFASVLYLKGGIDSGFKAVEPESYSPRLMQMSGKGMNVRVREIDLDPAFVNSSDTFILDKGLVVYQFIPPDSSPFEKNAAMELVNTELKSGREELELTVIDNEEELLGLEDFWETLGGVAPEHLPQSADSRSVAKINDDVDFTQPKKLYQVSDDDGTLGLKLVKEDDDLIMSDVTSDDVWAVSVDGRAFFYVGSAASKAEKVAVRMHASALLEAMKLPRSTPSVIMSPGGKCAAWEAIFSA